jgi:hypothetical protein
MEKIGEFHGSVIQKTDAGGRTPKFSSSLYVNVAMLV